MRLRLFLLPVLGGLVLMAGCAVTAPPVYQVDFNVGNKPQMSFPEAYENLRHELELVKYSDQSGLKDIQVTSQGLSFTSANVKYSGNYDDIQSLAVNTNTEYSVDWATIAGNIPWHVTWSLQSDAQNFVDAVMAMKYYSTKHFSTDDAAALAEFHAKAVVWQALAQKPPLPEEARRFRVLADDAVQNKEFDKAASFYEQGLTIDPMWPAGQFNAAMIYKELGIYPMAVMHLKRYLELKPSDVNTYRDQMYIWEEKASEN